MYLTNDYFCRLKINSMNKILLLLLMSTSVALNSFVQAQCTVNIQGDTIVCEGDEPTYTAQILGPSSTLNTTTASGNNHRGNMFDIVATNAVTITSFDVSPMGNTTIEVYYRVGTWVGFSGNSAGWTLVTSVPITAPGGLVNVPLATTVDIPAGQTYSFYVTSNNTSVSLNYSNGTAVGSVFSSDANISFLQGGGMDYPFTAGTGAVYQPRVWNGAIHYTFPNLSSSVLWSTSETTPSIFQTVNGPLSLAVEATVSGCPTLYDTINISTSVPPVSAGSNQTICLGDTILLNGLGAVSYNWDNGVTDSVAFVPTISGTTTYTVTGTDLIGCTNIATVDVNVNELPVVDAGNDIQACDGEEITLAGQGADSYQWDNSITDNVPFIPLVDQQFVVVGTDVNGCVGSDTINVYVNALPIVQAGSDFTACTAEMIALGGTGADTYIWNNGITNDIPFAALAGTTTYVVTGTDVNGCTDTDTIDVTTTPINAPIQINGAVLSTPANPLGTLQWYNCDLNQNIAGENGTTYTPTTTGNYAVIVADTNTGCSEMSDCMLVDFTAIAEAEMNLSVVSPNPTAGLLSIQTSQFAIEHIQVVDLLGKVVMETSPQTLQTTLDLTALEGTQFMILVYSNQQVETHKVVKY